MCPFRRKKCNINGLNGQKKKKKHKKCKGCFLKRIPCNRHIQYSILLTVDESLDKGLHKSTRNLMSLMDMFMILTVVIISQVYTYNINQII